MASKKYFQSPQSLEELRRQYKELLKKYHPDCPGGSTAATQAINAEYDELFKQLKNRHEKTGAADSQEADKAANSQTWDVFQDKVLREMIQKIIILDGLNVEICGTWIWVSGNTYLHKDTLKSYGFKWGSTKKMWYWYNPETDYTKRTRSVSMEFIREKYGSMEVETRKQACIA